MNSRRDICSDVAAILHPTPSPELAQEDEAGFSMAEQHAIEDRCRAAEELRLAWEEGGIDPVVSALANARRAKEAAEQKIRELLAYGREFVQPRPYTLGDLAAAAGMSISGVRTAYNHGDVDAVSDATGAKPREWRAQDPEPHSPGGERA
ncbi:hypothetical protein [Dactylosporangium salmoneum]|uniref:Helix-turn-helix DNA binding domain protein n=1 Tax=Dactylosporangium salmoneum TaxID=53361 RepID=A0ABP5SUL5_9ACTN